MTTESELDKGWQQAIEAAIRLCNTVGHDWKEANSHVKADAASYLVHLIKSLTRPQSGEITDKERLDWLEKQAAASGYHTEICGCMIPQSNGVIINLRVGSGPFQKQIRGIQGRNPVRIAIDAAISQPPK